MATTLPTTVPRNTKLEAEGAEFLVLGSLLAEGIAAWKAYTNFPGYDLVAGDVARGRICRIQVKSRYSTGAPGFPMSNFDCDFVCFVRLNRGYLHPRPTGSDGRRSPEIYVLPRPVARRAWVKRDRGPSAVSLGRIRDADQYLDAWDQIRDFLASKKKR